MSPVQAKSYRNWMLVHGCVHDKNPDASKVKHPQWSKGMIKSRENPRKYHILADDSDRVVIMSRCHIKGYYTRSGRCGKDPERLIEHNCYCKIYVTVKDFM